MSRWILACASVLLSALPTLIAWGDGPGPAQGADETIVELKSFPHSNHVHESWLKNEVPRDCRGCHDFDEKDGIREPEQTCVLCHYDFPDGKKALRVEGMIAGMRSTDSTFAHGDHLDLDCAACHRPKAKDLTYPGVPDQMFIPKGLGWCVDCHDPKAANPSPKRSRDDAGFQQAINANPKMRANPNAVFRHSEHLSSAELKEKKNCARCHDSVAKAEADMGEQVYNAASCGDCHVNEAGKSLPFGIKTRKYVSGADLAFYHSDHLSAEALKASGRLRDEGCFACHQLGEREGRGVSDYPLKRGYDKYEQCAKCHGEEDVTWRGLKGSSAPQPVTWRIDDHADVSDRNTCIKCHVIGVPGAMKTTRVKRDSERSRPGVFEIKVQAHPHMTGPNDKKNRDCRSCHLAEADLIPSRIREKRFRHESHLDPKSDANAQCLTCHEMTGTDRPGLLELEGRDRRRLSYREDACTQCHRGVKLIQPSSWKSPLGKTILFDHGDHVTHPDKPLKCGECHVPGPEGDREYAFAAGAKDCSKCHDHGEHAKDTGNRDQGYVNGCVACHEVHEPGLPQPGTDLFASRVDIHSIKGAQFHPLPGEKRCADCHRPGFTHSTLKESTLDLVLSDTTYSRPRDFHGTHEKSSQTPRYCYACHWNSFDTLAQDVVTEAVVGGQVKSIKGAAHSQTRNADRIRQVLGGELKGYPGIVK